MVRLTTIRNPFDPISSREVVEVASGRTLRELMQAAYPGAPAGYHIAVSVDGHRVADDALFDRMVPGEGSSVVMCAVPMGGGGKNPLAIVAALALMVVAPQVGFLGISALGFVAFPILETAISIGFLVAGGLAISAIFPMSQPDMPPTGGAINNSPTYSWETGANPLSEGIALPEVFGTCRVVPPIIGRYIETSGDAQFYNALMAVAGHPVDSISSVRINENPIIDPDTGATLISASTETRLGAVTQGVIPYFSDTRTDVAVGVKLTTNWTTRTTSGNALKGFVVTLGMPKGLYYAADDGSLEEQIVNVNIEYKKHTDTEWTGIQLKNISDQPVVIIEDRWSAGYIHPASYGWIEIQAGTTTPGDHYEGELLPESTWIIYVNPNAPDEQTPTRLPVYWHWVLNASIVYQPGAVIGDYAQIRGATSSPIHRTFSKDLLDEDQYDIRCRLTESYPESTRYANEVWWDATTELIYDDFTYPGTSLLAVRALATDQLSGSIPRIDCVVARNHVHVWTGARYEGKPANNPAWACYHLLHRAQYKGTGDYELAASYEVMGVAASRIDYDGFQSWAAWCTQKEYTVNLYVDQAASIRKALDMVATLGRGCVVQLGSKFTAIVDRIEPTPVQRFMFTMGNIIADSFREEWLSVMDRANAIEVTYFDKDEDYSRQTVTVYAQDYDTSDREINTLQVTLFGCVDRTQAIKHGKFLINSNKYLTLTCSFDADVDAIACIPGDVIEVAHDVPQWGYSGRVVSATTNTLTLDRPVTVEAAKSYAVMVKHQDDDSREEKYVTSTPGTYTTISISGTWGKTPELHALYSFGEVDHVVKEFRVLRITRSQEMRRRITALEYVAEVYEDGATIPPPEIISDLPRTVGLTATEVYRGGQTTYVHLSWRGYAMSWRVFISRPFFHPSFGWLNGPPELLQEVFSPSYEIGGLDYGRDYNFYVSPTENYKDGLSVSIQLRGKIDPPGNVPSITATELDRDYAVRIEWGAVEDFDLWGYELRVEEISEPYPYPHFSPDWALGQMLFSGNARNFTWTYKTVGGYCFHVRAVDAFGNYSRVSATAIVDIGAPDAPEGSYIFSGPNAVLSWNVPEAAFAIDHYIISYGSAYATSTAVGTTKGTTFSVNVTWGGTRRYWVVAVDVAGNDGTPEFIDVEVFSPGSVVALTPRVIDNNVLLYWTAPTTGSLPISHYAVSKGDTYLTSVDVGTVNGTFATVFEEEAGSYIYWVRPYDSAGNAGTAVGIPATVNQPPDYVLLQSWTDDFSGTPASALLYEGVLYAPIDITETYQEHFDDNSLDSPWEQVITDFPAWIMPVPTTATYTRVFDYGVLITALTKITLEVSRDDTKEWGTVTVAPSIEVSTNGSSWGTPVEEYTALESNFRYVRVILSLSGSGNDDIAAISSIRLKLDLKQKTDAGRVEVTTNGIQVDFNETFLDITSITVTAEGTTALFAIYDFTDAPNPTHFHVYLFDAGGNDASGSGKYASWTARGA